MRPLLSRIENSPVGYRLAKGVFWTLAGSVISRSLMLLASILVARMLGKDIYGEYGMVRSTVAMFGMLAGFSLGLTATKHVAEYRLNDPDRAGRIIGLSSMFSVLMGMLMMVVLFIFAPWLSEHTLKAPQLSGALRIGSLVMFINAVNGAQTGALSGFESFKIIARVNFLVGMISFPVLVCGAYLGGLNGAVWALAVNLCFHWLLNHMALQKEARRFRVPLQYKGCLSESSVLWAFSMPAFLSGIVGVPVFWICKSMLVNQPDGYAALGSITVTESWRMVPLFLCGMIEQVNLPILAQLYGNGDIRLFKKSVLAQLCINGTIVCVGAFFVILFSKPIMACYGPQFKSDYMALVFIILSTIPMQMTTVVGTVNRCIGKVKWNILINGIWAITFLIAATFLVQHGAVGFALATLIAYCGQLITTVFYLFWLFSAYSGFNNNISSKECP